MNLLDINDRYSVIDNLIDYYQYVRNPNELKDNVYNKQYQKVLLQRYNLPPKKYSFNTFKPKGPHQGRKSSLIGFGVLNHSSNSSAGKRIWFRPAYYDDLDADEYHNANSILFMGDLKVDIFNNKYILHSLKIINIESVNTDIIGLPGDLRRGWDIDFGIRQENFRCENCALPYLSGGIGYMKKILKGAVFSRVNVGAGIQTNRFDFGSMYTNLSVSLSSNISRRISIKNKIEYRDFISSGIGDRFLSNTELRFKLTKNNAIRISYEKNVDSILGLTYAAYW